MSGLVTLRARAEALRWAAELVEQCDPVDAAGFLRGVAEATESAIALVAPDYRDAEEEPPAEAAQPAEQQDDEPASIACELPEAPRRASRGPWTEEQLAALRNGAGRTPARDIAEAIGRPLQSVYNKANELGLSLRLAQPVPLPDPAARQAAEEAAAATVADADIGTIRHWLATQGGMPVADHLTAELVAAQANERRIELGLTPFRLVKHPIGAPTVAELTRMQRAGEARDG